MKISGAPTTQCSTCAQKLKALATINQLVSMDAETLQQVLDAPSYSDMRRLAADTTKRGIVAGDFLASIFAMYSFPNHFREPSVRKAVVISQAFAQRSRYRDGSKLPRSATTIRRCFEDVRPSIHLWAAFRLHQAFPIRSHTDILGNQEAIRDFLGIAATLQDFGCWFIPKRAKPKKPLLDKSSIWRVPNSIRRLAPPWKEPPSWLLETVKSYRPSR
jgi:hypothetical protein